MAKRGEKRGVVLHPPSIEKDKLKSGKGKRREPSISLTRKGRKQCFRYEAGGPSEKRERG